MKFTVPMEPHTAGRPRFSDKTGRVTRTVMDQGYRKWREHFQEWFENYLTKHNNDLLNYMTATKEGLPVRNEETGQIIDAFNGYLVRIICVLKRPKGSRRAFPSASNTPDIDNLYKAVSDGMFESKPFKYVGINDRWIQTLQCMKRYTMLGTDEKPHIEVEILRIE